MASYVVDFLKYLFVGRSFDAEVPAGSRWQDLFPSETAASVAKVRYLLQYEGNAALRLRDDPVVAATTTLAWRGLVAVAAPTLARSVERLQPGVLGGMAARTRFIDGALDRAVARGAAQVVIAGAGFDSRAYGPLNVGAVDLARGAARVFEVDLPLTQARKVALVEGLGLPRAHVTYVACDVAKDDVLAALAAAGFDAAEPTAVVLEGLTMYLAPSELDALFGAFGGLRDATLVFDYFSADFVDGRAVAGYGARHGRAYNAGIYEKWVGGFPADRAGFEARMARHGLAVADHADAAAIDARLLGDSTLLGADLRIGAYYNVAQVATGIFAKPPDQC